MDKELMKEKIAMRLSDANQISTPPKDRHKWGQILPSEKNMFRYLAGAILPIIEEHYKQETPKELMDYILSEDEIENVTENIALTYIGEKAHKAKEGDLDKEISTAIAKAQLEKCKPYVEEQVNEAVKAEREDTCSKLICIEENLDYSHEGYVHFRNMVLSLVKELEGANKVEQAQKDVATVPKELMDCLLSESERLAITEEDACYNFMEVSKATAEAQLEKCKAYITEQVQAQMLSTLEDMKSMELIKNHNHKKGATKLVSCARCSFNSLLERAKQEINK